MTKHGGLQEALEGLLHRDVWAMSSGQVVSWENHPDFGLLVDCVERPGGKEVQARLQHVGSVFGGAGGFAWPIEVDQEVLLFYPQDDPNQAIALAGVVNRSQQPPADFDNSKPVFQHPEGVEFRKVGGAAVEEVCLAPLLEQVKGIIDALQLFINAVNSASAATPTLPVTHTTLAGFLTAMTTSLLATEATLTTAINGGGDASDLLSSTIKAE